MDAALRRYKESKQVCKKVVSISCNFQPTYHSIRESLMNWRDLHPLSTTGLDTLDETYTMSTLGGAQAMSLVFSVQEIAAIAEVEKLTKRKVISINGVLRPTRVSLTCYQVEDVFQGALVLSWTRCLQETFDVSGS